MTIVLLGASGSGKSTIEHELSEHNGFAKIISYTTRQKRDGEENGRDYYFTNNDTFDDMINRGLFAEYDEYSQKRLYGTLKSDYVEGDSVVVLTPNGLRQLKKNCNADDIFTVFVEASLGTRIKRYIDRCGVDKFNFDDADEIFARINRDFGMFLGLEKEVDIVVRNDEGSDIKEIVKEILECLEERKMTLTKK